jgi:c-di-GMP-binding flagellar brake protein YcgR
MGFSLKQFIPFFNVDTEQVSDADFRQNQKITEIFELLKETRTVLQVTLPGTNKTYTSSILSVDTAHGQFTLDEIFPEDGHRQFEDSGKLIAHAELRGARISFETCRVDSDNSRQISSYNCQIPQSISYIQRRAEYRIPVPAIHIVDLTAEHRNTSQILQGRLYDISTKGIGIVFKTTHSIKPGDRLTRCQLPLSSTETVSFTLEVRHIESTTPDAIRVGASFLDLDSRSREMISRFVRQMERSYIKSQ